MVGLIDRAQSSLVALSEAVMLIDDLNQIEWFNPATEKLLGIQPWIVVVICSRYYASLFLLNIFKILIRRQMASK